MTQVWAVITAAFLASLVEAVEALTIVLAVAAVRGPRPAVLGALAGFALLVVIVLVLGPVLGYVPLHALQLLIGILLLLFGMRWLRKAILRSAGVIPLHDEAAAFAAETEELREQARRHEARRDWLAGVSRASRPCFWRGWKLFSSLLPSALARSAGPREHRCNHGLFAGGGRRLGYSSSAGAGS